ncbi:hypothetical protein IWW57_004557, partial [Coemansia sp. S610]
MGTAKKVQGTLSSFFKPKPAAAGGDKSTAPEAASALPMPVAESPKPTTRRKSQAAESARKRRRVIDTGDSDDEANPPPATSDNDYKSDTTARPKLSKQDLSSFLHSGT